MDLGLKVMLVVAFLLNFMLGYAISWFLVDKLASSEKGWGSLKKSLPKTVALVLVGSIVSIITFAITIILIWPPALL